MAEKKPKTQVLKDIDDSKKDSSVRANRKSSEGVGRKKELVEKLAEKIKSSKTVLLASTKGLPSSQFQTIKKKLRGKAEIMVVKKSIILRAIEKIEKGAVNNLKGKIGSDIAIFFSELDAFELSGLLSDEKSPTKAKPGDIAPEDISAEPGPTEMIPGPAISELSSVGLKVAVENGKIAIKKGSVLVKKGEAISPEVASVLGKLDIIPMKVGFEPIAAYDSRSDKTYDDVKIDKEGALEELRGSIGKALGFALNVEYVSGDTVKFMIARAGAHERVLSAKIGEGEVNNAETVAGGEGADEKDGDSEKKEGAGEEKVDEPKVEEKKEEAPKVEESKVEEKPAEEKKESVKKEENAEKEGEKNE